MAMNANELFSELEGHCYRVGYFDRVNLHEPKNGPARGLTAAIWLDRMDPTQSSGLATTSMRLEFMVRIYSNMLQEPVDMIDPQVLIATDALMASFTGEFTLNGEVMDIDLLGRYGQPLGGQSGYVGVDNKVYRCMTIRVPMILDNLWEQVR